MTPLLGTIGPTSIGNSARPDTMVTVSTHTVAGALPTLVSDVDAVMGPTSKLKSEACTPDTGVSKVAVTMNSGDVNGEGAEVVYEGRGGTNSATKAVALAALAG